MAGNLFVPNQTQVPIGVLYFPGDNAVPVSASFGANGSVTVACVGGLTKRQELAARFLAAILGANHELPNEPIDMALTFADALLAATEDSNPPPANNPPV